MLNTVRPEVELLVTAGDIPEKITLDISGASIGDTLTIKDIPLPAGAKPVIDRDFVIANIAAPTVLGAGAEDDGDEGAEAAEAEAEA
jgi:large subunit ribosomal protein L25